MKQLRNNFISILVLTIASFTFFSGCTSKIDEGDKGSFPYLEVDSETISIGKEANDNIVVNIKTNRTVNVGISAGWLSVKSSASDRLVLAASENTEEYSRNAAVTISISGGAYTRVIDVVQSESGVRTYRGDLFICTDDELAEFTDVYNRMEGNLILGDESGTPTDFVICCSIGEIGQYYFRRSHISSLNTLNSSMTEIIGGIYVVANDISNLSPLSVYDKVNRLELIANRNVVSIDFIESMTGLSDVIIMMMPSVTDFSSLAQLPNLKSLTITCNGLDNVDFLSSAKNLSRLVLGMGGEETNNIYDLSPLYGLSNLSYLDISGLPVSPAEVLDLVRMLPNCQIVAENMRTGTPIISPVEIIESTNSSLSMSANIEDFGITVPEKAGFRVGTDLSDPNAYTEYLVEISPDNTITFTVGDLLSSSKYYIQAFAENKAGTGESEVLSTYTEGMPVLREGGEVNREDYYTVTIRSIMDFPGSKSAVYGSIIGILPDLDTNTCIAREQHIFDADYETEIEWQDIFTNLNSGTRYYIRSFACNKYGIVYGDIHEVVTGGTPNQNRYDLAIYPSIPVYTGTTYGNELPSQMYATFFRNDIIGSGQLSLLSFNQDSYSYSLYEGVQDIVLINTDGTLGNMSCVTNVSGTELVKYSVSGNTGTGTQLIAGILRNENIESNKTVGVDMQRLTSRISISVSYQDPDGTIVADLSSRISSIKVTADGLSSELTLNDGLQWKYGGSSQLYFDISDISTTSIQKIATNVDILPAGVPMVFTVQVIFNDQTEITLKTAYKTIVANTDNNITLRLSQFENDIEGGFTVDAIEEIDEEIEF